MEFKRQVFNAVIALCLNLDSLFIKSVGQITQMPRTSAPTLKRKRQKFPPKNGSRKDFDLSELLLIQQGSAFSVAKQKNGPTKTLSAILTSGACDLPWILIHHQADDALLGDESDDLPKLMDTSVAEEVFDMEEIGLLNTDTMANPSTSLDFGAAQRNRYNQTSPRPQGHSDTCFVPDRQKPISLRPFPQKHCKWTGCR